MFLKLLKYNFHFFTSSVVGRRALLLSAGIVDACSNNFTFFFVEPTSPEASSNLKMTKAKM